MTWVNYMEIKYKNKTETKESRYKNLEGLKSKKDLRKNESTDYKLKEIKYTGCTLNIVGF